MAILKADVTAPVLPEARAVLVPELGGEVIIRPLTLSDRLDLAASMKGTGGEKKNFGHIAPLLAYCVLDGNNEPLFTSAEWEAWGAVHMAAALSLWDAAFEVSGLQQAVATKNLPAQNSDSQ